MQEEVQNIEIKGIENLKKKDNINGLLGKVGVPAPYEQACEALLRVFETLRDDLIVAIEYDYVDLMYRNEYYNFYATKKYDYERNCAKLSFFEPNALSENENVKYTQAKIDLIKSGYLGYLIVRPIAACVGRNAISVKAKTQEYNNITICETKIQSSALGLTVSVNAFPHSSQDNELMVCAETALWSMFEYFGNKYPIHRTALPSEILKSVEDVTYQRQTPSSGLYSYQMSAALKNLGLNPKVYSLNDMIFDSYVESGIPVLLYLTGTSVDAHATVCIGYDNDVAIKEYKMSKPKDDKQKEELIIWRKTSLKGIVINDDNAPNCQLATIDNPTQYFEKLKIPGSEKFKGMKIAEFIVPLPLRVYMDAYDAFRLIMQIERNWLKEKKITRTILISSHALREHIVSSSLPNMMKTCFLKLSLPHYLWVTELSTKSELKENKVSGMIIFDATDRFCKPSDLIFCFTNNKKFFYDALSRRTLFMDNPDEDFILEKYNKGIN